MLHPLLMEQISESLAMQSCSANASHLFTLISKAYYHFEEMLDAGALNNAMADTYNAGRHTNDYNHPGAMTPVIAVPFL